MTKITKEKNNFDVTSANALFDILSLLQSCQNITQEKNHFDVSSADGLFDIISLWKSEQKIA